MHHNRFFYFIITISLLSLLGCQSGASSEGNNSLPSSSLPLKWLPPTHRINGTAIDPIENLSYEIWAGYDEESLFWIYTHKPTSNQEEIELNLLDVLQNEVSENTSSLIGETLYFGVIAVDENNNRSSMSELKAIPINI